VIAARGSVPALRRVRVSSMAGREACESTLDPATEEVCRGHDLEGQAGLKYQWGENMARGK